LSLLQILTFHDLYLHCHDDLFVDQSHGSFTRDKKILFTANYCYQFLIFFHLGLSKFLVLFLFFGQDLRGVVNILLLKIHVSVAHEMCNIFN
jgi:hypothetical protein